MKRSNPLSRREFLRLAGLGGGALALAACQPAPPTTLPGQPPAAVTTAATQAASGHAMPTRAAQPTHSGPADVELDLTAQYDELQILPGQKTRVWRYQGQVLNGDPAALHNLPGAYPGPVFRVKRGQEVAVHFHSQVPQETIVHWHGLSVTHENDGHPVEVINEGQSYEYRFPVINRAGTYWFHPHPHGITGRQVMYGLAGLFIVSDDEEAALGLPDGEQDVPLVIQDRIFDPDNQFYYAPDPMMGFFGEQVLVNGQVDFTLTAAPRPHRLRLLNGSNARVYKLAWDDGTPLTVIGTDGGLLAEPVERAAVTLAPGERVELWADFSAYPDGRQVRLKSLAFSIPNDNMGGMMGMMGGGPPNGTPMQVLTVRIQGEPVKDARRLPTRLSQPGFLDPQTSQRTRRFELLMQHMIPTINGRTFNAEDMTEVAPDDIVPLGSTETWEFFNAGGAMGGMGRGMGRGMGGMMEAMPHPMHVHACQFQVIERLPDPATQAAYDTLSGGFVDTGWKDTVLVLPGEQVRVLVRFADYPGLYLYHCHNLEHEDLGMMRNFRIEA